MMKPLQSILNHLKLGQKLTILLLIVFTIGVTTSGIALANILNNSAQSEITAKAMMLMSTMLSVRDYTSTQITPELKEKLATEFLPQTIPSYSAREVFEKLRASEEAYKEFFYKEATLNPTNLRDKADAFEAPLVERFRQDANLKELRGFYDSPSGKLFYIARPLRIVKESCLQCHSTPEAAPKTMVERYGAVNGFGWKLNEVVSAQMISVPAHTVLQNAQQSFLLLIGVFILIFATTILAVNFWLKRYVVRPLKRMAKVAEAVSMGDIGAEFERTSNDEVGSLAETFARMKMSLTMAMQRLDQYRSGRRSVDRSVDRSVERNGDRSVDRSVGRSVDQPQSFQDR
jgi:HAMP domain-containing protein